MESRIRMTLSGWIGMFDRIYFESQNYDKYDIQINGRLGESITSLQDAAVRSGEIDATCEKWLPKVFAWYCSLVRVLNIEKLEDEVWRKFPYICPFCSSSTCECESLSDPEMLDQGRLSAAAERNSSKRPGDLKDWQELFDEVYDQSSSGLLPVLGEQSYERRLERACLKLHEERTELAEAIRLKAFFPSHVVNESVDLFAAICGFANVISTNYDGNLDLGELVWNRYPDRCDTCSERICICRETALEARLSNEGIHIFEQRDALTELLNREKYDSDRASFFRQNSPPVAEIFFDIDDFKSINDQSKAGHDQGDAVLEEVARRAKKAIPERGQLYRFGGDEFAILVDGDTNDEIVQVARDVVESVSRESFESLSEEESPFEVELSVGVAIASDEESASDLHQRADKLMYEAKESDEEIRTCL